MFTFTKGIILDETEYRALWSHFVEILKNTINELDSEEREIFLRNREGFERWIDELVSGMFEFILEENNAEVAMIYLGGEWYYVPDGQEFYYVSRKKGDIPKVIKELEEELRKSVKRSRRRR